VVAQGDSTITRRYRRVPRLALGLAPRSVAAVPPPQPCTVWWAAPIAPDAAPALVGLLDVHERERLTRFRRPADRARYLAAHALTRLALAPLVGCDPGMLAFDRTCRCGEPDGKPVLPGGPGFSLSHAGDLVGVAVRPDGPVGLDVEQLRDVADLDALAAHVRSPTERSRPGLDAAGFFRTWTRKEALVKATGDGLAAPMTAITLARHGPVVERWTGPGAPSGPMWLHDLSPAADHPAAVAGPGERAPEIVEADGDAVLRA
jgi:4'-phosphopantetheinyl transferase